MNYYSGKKVWVTGASSGIGEQLVYQLSKAGAQLIISSRRQAELEKVKSGCFSPNAVEIVVFDQQNEQSIISAAEHVHSKYGSIDILFNNGGISQRGEAMKTSLSLERNIFEINFFSNILLSKLVAEKMILQRSGHLVITSSLLGKWGFHLRSSYSATKHALHGYYDSMRMEIEKHHVLVTLVMPGFIATEISKHAMNEKGEPTGEMDNNQASGISAELCATKILEGVSSRKKEFGVGGQEIMGLKVKRYLPNFFDTILRKRSAK